MQPALFKTAQGLVCQWVIYDVSLVLLTGIFHFSSLSTFSSSSTRALLCPPLITTFRPVQSPPGQLHLMPSSQGRAGLHSHGWWWGHSLSRGVSCYSVAWKRQDKGRLPYTLWAFNKSLLMSELIKGRHEKGLCLVGIIYCSLNQIS